MLRSSPLWMLLTALGGISGAAWADEPPLCPTLAPPPAQTTAAPASASGASTASTASTATAAPHARKPKSTAPGSTAPGSGPTGGPITVSSDQEAVLGIDGTATVKGNVEVRQGDRVIHAHEVQYNPKNETVKAEGQIEYNDPLMRVAGAGGGSYSTTGGLNFRSAEFQMHQRAARGTAADISASPDGVVSLKGVTFTTCPLHNDAWLIRADSIVLDTRTEVGTGRDAKIDFMGVPLIYLPWLSFPLDTERKSGFLFPTLGNTSSSGVQLSLPYYFNIAPNMDFTFEPTVYSKRGADLGGDFRFLTPDQRGELQWNYLPNDSVYGGSRSRVRLNDVAELPADFRLTLDAQNVSDPLYFQDFSQSPEGTSTAFLNRSALLSYRDEHWVLDAQAQQYQTIDDTLSVDDRPYARVPRLTLASRYSHDFLHYGFDSEVVQFQHAAGAIGPNGWREDVMPEGSLDFSGAGYFFRPGLAWRFTAYQLDDLLPGEVHAPSRSLPLASVDSGLVFEKPTGSRNQRTLTLEPRLMYLYVPYRNQSQLPVFDTAIPDLTPVQLFSPNRYVGADRVSDANQLSWGVTSRLLDALDGREYLAATIGQAYYFQTPRVTLPLETPLTGKHSDFVAQLSVTAFQNWGAEAGVQWDPQNQRSERTLVALQYKAAPDAVINLAYRYQRFEQVPEYVQGMVPISCLPLGSPLPPPPAPGQPPPELPTCDSRGYDQVDFSGAWPIRRNWTVFLRDVYSIRDSKELERFLGFEYRSCCWRLRLGARRYVSSFSGSQDTGIWLQLELAGLAGVGSASDTSLSEEIRGYTPLDANTQRLGAH